MNFSSSSITSLCGCLIDFFICLPYIRQNINNQRIQMHWKAFSHARIWQYTDCACVFKNAVCAYSIFNTSQIL